MISSGAKEKYVRKEGSIGISSTQRYVCYHRTRKLNDCDGQSVYSAKRVEGAVLAVVERYLQTIRATPKDKALEIRYKKAIAEKRKIKKELTEQKELLQKRLSELSIEVGKCLSGENRFPADILAMSINSTKEEMAEIERQLHECECDMEQQSDMVDKLDYYYQQFVTWADEFDNASLEQRKMIICQLIDSIKVGRGYEISIEFNSSYSQFFGDNTAVEERAVINK